MLRKNIVYGIIDPRSGRLCYVGKSTIGETRWAIHRRSLSKGTHQNVRLQRIFNLLLGVGKELSFEVIEYCDDKYALEDREIYWIAKLKEDGLSLVNMTNGGGGTTGIPMPDHVKKKLIASRLGAGLPEKSRIAFAIRNKRLSEEAEERKRIKALAPHKKKGANGSKQHLAKLKESDIPKILAAHKNGQSAYSLAKKYGMSNVSMWAVCTGKTWKHVTGAMEASNVAT